MKKASNSIGVSLLFFLSLLTASCGSTVNPVSPTSPPAQPVVVGPQQFSGSGISQNTYQVALTAGISRLQVSSSDPLTVEVTGPNGANVGRVNHVGIPADSMTEIQITADGTYQLIVNHAGAGSWTVIVGAPGAAPAPTQPPAASPVPAQPTSAPAGSQLQEFSGSGISQNTYQVALGAGIARFQVSTNGALTVDVVGPNGAQVGQVKHVGVPGESTAEVQIPANGTYQLTINHAGVGNWTVTVDSPTAAPAPAQPAAASPTPQQPAVPAAGPQQFSGSGISQNTYQMALRAGVARFQVSTNGALTVEISGPDGQVGQVNHVGVPADSTAQIQIPADGTYRLTINHAGVGNWTVTVTP